MGTTLTAMLVHGGRANLVHAGDSRCYMFRDGRLKQLTDIGLFVKQAYREPGKRTRSEYLLTDKGRDLLPAVFALMQWGNAHLQGEDGGPLRLVERGTGEPVVIGPRTASGRILDVEDLAIVAHGDWPERQDS